MNAKQVTNMAEILILFAGAFIAAAVSGAAGFGGALLLLPLMVHRVGAELAVPLLTITQIVGNASRIAFGWKQIQWRMSGYFLLTALPAAAVGALSFVNIPRGWLVRLIGILLLLVVVLHTWSRWRPQPDKRGLLIGGALTGLFSGLAGSAGPLGAAVFLSLGLPPIAYLATEATSAVALHLVKLAVYQPTLHLPVSLWSLALWLGVAMVLGTWASRRLVERIPPKHFRAFVTVLLVLVGLRMALLG